MVRLRTFRLTGPFAGQTKELGGVKFTNGLHSRVMDDETFGKLFRYLSRCWEVEEGTGDDDGGSTPHAPESDGDHADVRRRVPAHRARPSSSTEDGGGDDAARTRSARERPAGN